jgi:hypothetical protein
VPDPDFRQSLVQKRANSFTNQVVGMGVFVMMGILPRRAVIVIAHGNSPLQTWE